MRIFVNGDERDVREGISVLGLLETLALGEDRVAVAVNREVIPRAKHGSRVLGPGDRVEIVHAVQGG